MLTTAKVAASLGVSRQTVALIAKDHGIGTLATPRLRTYTQSDVAAVRRALKARRRTGEDYRAMARARWHKTLDAARGGK